MKTHEPKTPKIKPPQEFCYDCTDCHFQGCTDLYFMKKHYSNKHIENNYKCQKCGQQLTKDGYWEKQHVDDCMKFTKPDEAPILEPIPNNVPNYRPDGLFLPTDEHPFWQDRFLHPYLPGPKEAIAKVWMTDVRQHFDTHSKLCRKYIFRTAGLDVTDFRMDDALVYIYHHNEHAFNLKIALGKIDNLSFLTENMERPNTKWRFICTLSVCYYVYIRNKFVAGKGHSRLPNYLTQNKNLDCMERDKNGNYFKDNLCFFRCVVRFQGGDPDDIESVVTCYEKFRRHVNGPFWKEYDGMSQSQIPTAEEVYDLNVQILRFVTPERAVVVRKAINVKRPVLNIVMHFIDDDDDE
jgi:hypothetical protein